MHSWLLWVFARLGSLIRKTQAWNTLQINPDASFQSGKRLGKIGIRSHQAKPQTEQYTLAIQNIKKPDARRPISRPRRFEALLGQRNKI